MKLTPLDVQQQQFRSTVWGFDPKEVDAFLDQVATAFEELIREVNSLREQIQVKEAQLDEHRDREKALKETMLTATRIADEVKQGARKESELVISAAEVQAEQIIQNAYTRLARVMDEINELKRQRVQFEANLRSLVASHTKLLDAMGDRDQQLSPVEMDAIQLSRRRATEGADAGKLTALPGGEGSKR
ncbi:MAG: DivIVA domain-containing protein [Deltaproteobacteria bacterium]|nr:DivIVA domain-containing protein [Deltaproteobacteria bacterium]